VRSKSQNVTAEIATDDRRDGVIVCSSVNRWTDREDNKQKGELSHLPRRHRIVEKPPYRLETMLTMLRKEQRRNPKEKQELEILARGRVDRFVLNRRRFRA